MTELRDADLRFAPQEAVRFLTAAMGLPLSDDEAPALASRTEGWIAGLQLAALALQALAPSAQAEARDLSLALPGRSSTFSITWSRTCCLPNLKMCENRH